MALSKCPSCRSVVMFSRVKVQGKVWHKKCFKCTTCAMVLTKNGCEWNDDKPYCLKHVRYQSSTTPPSHPSPDVHRNARVLPNVRENVDMDTWYHGNLPREEADLLLRKDGDFLVRQSNGEYVLSILWNSQTIHSRLPQQLSETACSDSFPAVRDWVLTQWRSGTVISSRSGAILKNPIAKQAPIPPSPRSHPSRKSVNTRKSRLSLYQSAEENSVFEIVETDICLEKVDAIVNSVGTSLNLSVGALSKAISEAAGLQEIQKELRGNASKAPADINLHSTKGYLLPCKHVIHVVLKFWKDDGQPVQYFRQIVNKILAKAVELKAKSLAIPPIGTGLLGYPKKIVSQIMYLEACDYLNSHPESGLEKIKFIVVKDVQLKTMFENLLEDDEFDSEVEESRKSARTIYENFQVQVEKTLRSSQAPGTMSLPRNWILTSETSDKLYLLIELEPKSEDYVTVVSRLNPSIARVIYKIERIENCDLYHMYNAQKQVMTKKNGKEITNESLLYHGTSYDSLSNIFSFGFNRSYCGQNAAYYGNGVYFAVNFSYSSRSNYSPPDRNGLKHIFQCRVLTGQYCVGEQGLREPPLRDKTLSLRFDSVVDEMNSPQMFVTFKDYSAYPEYLITFYESATQTPD